MASELFCMGCMQPLSEFSDSCYHCGYPAAGQNPAGYLPVRTQLSGRYVVGRALEKRSDAIVYIGYDKTARNTVLIREFFPRGLAERLSRQVVAASDKEVPFNACYEQFLKQARIIARMRELPAMIPVYDLFEENGTAYTVSDHVEGIPFRRHIQSLGGHMKWEEARPMFVPLISSLISLHAAGLYHLGISPDSILVDGDNRLRLDGWQLPAVRMTGDVLKTKLHTGYAAPEQYQGGKTPSQAADVYALGATMLYALTGEEPPSAEDRVNRVASLMVPATVAEKWPAHIAPTLCDALMLNDSKRIQTVEQLRDRLTTAPVVEALRGDAFEEEHPKAKAKRSKAGGGNNVGYKITVGILSGVAAVLTLVIVLMAIRMSRTPEAVPADTTVTTATTVVTTTTAPTAPPAEQYAVENVVGLTMDEVKERQLSGNMTVVVKGKQYSDDVKVGVITEQIPAPQTYADKGSVIEVYLSGGPSEKALSDVSGWPADTARSYLEMMGYTVSEVKVTESRFDKGLVNDTVPAAGTMLEEGDEVVLHVSDVTTTTAPRTAQTTRPFGGN